MGRANAGAAGERGWGIRDAWIVLLLLWVWVGKGEGQNVSFAIGASEFSSADLVLLGDAFINGDKNLELTQDSVIRQLESSVGRALYRDPVRVFDRALGRVASFHTSFEFRITNTSEVHGDGMAFVLVPDNSTLGSYGGWLGVLNSSSDGHPGSRTLAVELDTYQNGDPIFDPDGNHVGIDLNDMRSIVTANMSAIGMGLLNGNNIKVWVDYDGTAKSLQVSINNAVPPVKPASPILSLSLDLSVFLNEFMYVGFAAATGGLIEIHTIFSWTFSSYGLPDYGPAQGPGPSPSPGQSPLPPPGQQGAPGSISVSPSPAPGPAWGGGSSGCGSFACRKLFVVAFSSSLGAVLASALGICFLFLFRRRVKDAGAAAGQNSDSEMVNGPRKFSLKELSVATKNFSSRKLLGSGGSGSVYMGVLPDCGTVVAVKRISAANRTGRREFAAELSIISRLRHRNLVPLRGWCSAKGQLLLVYDYMPNGSLDKLLFADLGSNARGHSSSDSGGSSSTRGATSCAAGNAGGAAREGLLWTWRRRESKPPPPPVVGAGAAGSSGPGPGPSCVGGFVLSWDRRYRIVSGVAAALAYLHEGWDQRVVHRDVKASNVMLDGGFNARLGDFGLARASEHSRQPETTVIVGTFGYLAPESTHTGKATDKTDVFSFGAVALEVACGRRPVEREYPVAEVVLVDWVWALNKQGRLLEAADARLQGSFDPVEMTTLLQVGLACSHPDPVQRPSMRQVVQVLAGDSALPSLPSSKPTPQYSAVLHPPVTMQDIIAQLDFSQSASMSSSFSGNAPPPED